MSTTSGYSPAGSAAASATDPALATTSISSSPSSSRARLSATSSWFSTITTRVPPRTVASGQLGAPHLVTGLELVHHRGDARPFICPGLTKPLSERSEPAADLFEAVDARHVELDRKRRGLALRRGCGPLPGRCPPV